MDLDTKQPGASTVDQAEVASFDAAAEIWWDPDGAARWLHRYNPVRVAYIRDAACRRFGRDPADPDCLRGLRLIDIGCGAGVLCEPLAALGATVVGADPGPAILEVARRHAAQTGVAVDYRCTTAEGLADQGERFDVVLALEVIEHVADAELFLRRCAELVAPGGLMILSTINRTAKSFAFAIVMAEYVLRLLPRGAHQWRRFLRPDEVAAMMGRDGLALVDLSGVTLNLLTRALQLSPDTSVNFILTAAKPSTAA